MNVYDSHNVNFVVTIEYFPNNNVAFLYVQVNPVTFSYEDSNHGYYNFNKDFNDNFVTFLKVAVLNENSTVFFHGSFYYIIEIIFI